MNHHASHHSYSSSTSSTSSSHHPPLHYHSYDGTPIGLSATAAVGHGRVVGTRATTNTSHPRHHHHHGAAVPPQSRAWAHPSSLPSNRHQRQRPLILDASPARNSATSSFPIVPTQQSQTTKPPTFASQSPLPPDPPHEVATAVSFARQAPQAGFLQKQGSNIREFKRRFFVLQPATHLYYFLSAQDTTPRGCLDLEGARIEHDVLDHTTNTTSNGIYRFAIVWDGDASTGGTTIPNKVLLEARSKQDALQWVQALEQERLPYVKGELAKAQRRTSAYASRVTELERQVADLKLVEQDRDGAIEDATKWKAQFMQLDESIRKLTQQLRRQPTAAARKQPTTTSTKTKQNDPENEDIADDETGITVASTEEDGDEEPAGRLSHKPSEISALDDDERESETVIDIRQVPGTHFSALYNTVEQLRENLRLASEEAVAAVEDVTTANERVQAVEQRMSKAEKHLCKIWEENCSLRKTLKQKKREKRVLVREIRNLRETAAMSKSNCRSTPLLNGGVSFVNEFMDVSDEEKLINDLEEHVISSIRLHEAFLAANGEIQADLGGQPSLDLDLSKESTGDDALRYLIDSACKLASENDKKPPSIHPNVPLFEQPQLQVASLFDESEDESDMSAVEEMHAKSAAIFEPNGVVDAGIVAASRKLMLDESLDDLEVRQNPILLLDKEDDEDGEQPRLCGASSQSESSKSSRVNHDQATSTLSCPLVDVVTTEHNAAQPKVNDDLQVYHLTFYSRKIGLQFQKVPPPPVKAKGLLTEAMTDDLAAVSSAGGKTAAELRRIAAISTRAKSSSKEERAIMCELATPVDAVLVCGFHGFSDSGANVRPKLGARLVAFDGVSVEVGKWTFDAVRKAIQARDRPLTLSFRNDFLTTEQRTILTKAVRDVDAVAPPPRRTIEYRSNSEIHPTSRNPSVQSALSSETGQFMNDGRSIHSQEDDLSESVAGSDYLRSFPQSFSGARSVSSSNAYCRSASEARSVSSGNFRSFSEAGSAASVLSAVAPLVSNLLNRRGEPFTPEYLRRAPESVEETPQHQDFKSELL